MEGIFVGMLRHVVPLDVAGAGLKMLMMDWLLIRRVILYLRKELLYKNDAKVKYIEGRSPEEILSTLFAYPFAFHRQKPRGQTLVDEVAIEQETPCQTRRSCRKGSALLRCCWRLPWTAAQTCRKNSRSS